MAFQDVLKDIYEKNPNLRSTDGVLKARTEKIVELLKYVYDEGVREGKESNSLFEGLFGKLGK